MTKDQAKIVAYVYRKFLENENRGWDEMDDYLEILEYLDDDQLYREADILLDKHTGKKLVCNMKHKNNRCFLSETIEAVLAILELYKDTSDLHKKNRYILQYYLALSQAGLIAVSNSPTAP